MFAIRRFGAAKRTVRWLSTDTIYALSTAPGKSAIAIVRISGAQTSSVLRSLLSRERLPRARQATVARLVDPSDPSDTLDTAVCLWLPGPQSYTGEDMAELHVHGGPAVVSSILGALGRLDGLRMAQAGEFTRRAFDLGKLDLTTLEGISDVLNAETEQQRRLAVRQMGGALQQQYSSWRTQLVQARAMVEAEVDFGDEEALESNTVARAMQLAHSVHKMVAAHLDDRRRGEILRGGARLAIVGPPNAGKSTMLNALVQRPAAIVSPVAGTTRDIVEVTLDIAGFPLVVSDTAGLRQHTSDLVEEEGVRRALAASRDADLRMVVVDCQDVLNHGIPSALAPEYRELLHLPQTLVVLSKVDILASSELKKVEHMAKQFASSMGSNGWGVAVVSCETMEGWDKMISRLAEGMRNTWGAQGVAAEAMPLTKARHREHLRTCVARLEDFARVVDNDLVLAAEELRAAADSIGRITGAVGIEDVLDALFSEFCIGK
ncbi:tRNA modification GTPase gtpbp3, mitochondrial [Coemansia sp. RSA 2703]|nr:tRNA modification GTPase gtpbp3, mitochondrial [Coemansia sp. RSA 2703]KAJ2379074.1 tRNA modification GTPase gtpbp3, mitochondrial [Coemansia sp. RSA 2607]KAJ2398534.1 tRNA modification GTPase gtpbp3, mitochondrial [Coemansia sp. RSA 2603]